MSSESNSKAESPAEAEEIKSLDDNEDADSEKEPVITHEEVDESWTVLYKPNSFSQSWNFLILL